jgi:DNA polymerase I-like protein with 3'-5' exonuclease and polymerase domains
LKSKATTADAYKLIHNGILALARAERQGIRIDTKYCERQRKRLTKKINQLEKEIQGSKRKRGFWQAGPDLKTALLELLRGGGDS